jgi:LysM repeat protein
LLVAACGSGNGATGNSGRLTELHNPKDAPTASPPSRLASPVAAVSVQGGSQTLGAQPNTYVVKAGDTLGAIASTLGVPVQDLERANNISDPSKLQVGQALQIPRPGATPAAGATAGASTSTSPFSTPGPAPTAAVGTLVPPTGGAPSGSGGPIGTASASASASASSTPGAQAGGTEYTVKQGDTGCSIAKANDISVAELAQANGLTAAQLARLQLNQLLKLPAPTGHRDC